MMLARLHRLVLSTMLSLTTVIGVGAAVPLVVQAAGQSCPVRYWSGPYVSEDDRTHVQHVQGLVVINCPIYGRGGDLVQYRIHRGSATGTVIASNGGGTLCGAGCDIHNIPAVAVSPACSSSTSTTYTPEFRVMVDDKFGWSAWTAGPAKTIPCRV